MDAVAERRRLIYEALERITAFELALERRDGETLRPDLDQVVAGFAAHRLQLMALFGRDSEVALAYQDLVNAIGTLIAFDHAAGDRRRDDDKRKQFQDMANVARERFVAAVEPQMTATVLDVAAR